MTLTKINMCKINMSTLLSKHWVFSGEHVSAMKKFHQTGKLSKRTNTSYLESKVKLIAERIFLCKFVKTRDLPWLINHETGRHLEIDLFNEELKLCKVPSIIDM